MSITSFHMPINWKRKLNWRIGRIIRIFEFHEMPKLRFPLSLFMGYFKDWIREYEANRGAVARSVTVKSTGCGFDPHSRRWSIYLNVYFHFFALVTRLSAALSSATHHAMPPEFTETGERSVLTLGSLCLPCCVRNTVWSWKIYIYI